MSAKSSRPLPATIEVFADVICPFTHVGLRRLVDRREELGRDQPMLVVRAWPLEIVNGEPVTGDFVAEEVEALRATVAPDLFTDFDHAVFPGSSLPALALAARAAREGLGEQCSLALRDALFEQGRDLGDPAELARIADTLGIGSATAADDAQVRADLDEGRSRGVIGSPHFFVDGHDFFCPSLEIARVDGHLRIDVDPAGFDALAVRCFGVAGSTPILG